MIARSVQSSNLVQNNMIQISLYLNSFNCCVILVGFFLILYHYYRLDIYVLYILLKRERNKDNNVLIVEISYALHAYTA